MAGLGEILDENVRLRALLADREALLAQHESRLAEQTRLLSQQEVKLSITLERVEELERYMAMAALRLKGPTSERYLPDNQLSLPLPGDIAPPPRAPRPDAEEEEDIEAQGPAKNPNSPRQKKGNGSPPKRRRLQDSTLPKRKVLCKADPEATCTRCGGRLTVIGQVVSYRAEWVPGHFVVDEVERDKCACKDCPSEGVLTVPAPYALPRAMCGNGLLARVLVDKAADHLPLNRQQVRMEREGFEVSTGTLSQWYCSGAAFLAPIAKAVRERLMKGNLLLGDDTGLPVQDGSDGQLRKGRLWVFTDQEEAFYLFTATKQGDVPAKELENFKGELLLVDGGSEFNQAVREKELERGGCWSHLRRYFFEARHFHPAHAGAALATIRDLFLLERDLHGQPPDAILQSRRQVAKPLVEGFFRWVRAMSTVTRPTSQLGEALTYASNQELRLRLFLDHPELPIHNNLSELLLRQPVVGRKNWLFAGSEGGAKAAATMYTLMGSCMLQGIDPYGYLVDVLERLSDHPVNRIEELTPRGWRLARA